MKPGIEKKFSEGKLWETFTDVLSQELRQTSIETFAGAWESNSQRTKYYFDSLLPKIAEKLHLGYETERTFRVDAILYKKAENGYNVPIIFIESENNADDTETEIYKLCCLNAPLKVIFICLEWTEERKKNITEDYWNYILDAFVKENCLIGYLGVIIARWDDDALKYSSFAYNQTGKIIEDEKILVELN